MIPQCRWFEEDSEWIYVDNFVDGRITINRNFNEIAEISIRALGNDSATFGYVTIPSNLWHNNGAYEILDTTFNVAGSFMGYGRIWIESKTENSFTLVLDGSGLKSFALSYKLKKKYKGMLPNDYGIIVESGSNSNGNWVKYSDGTMICYFDKVAILQNTLQEYVSLFQTIQDWTFPVSFINIPTVACGQFMISTGASWGTVHSVTESIATLRVVDVVKRNSGEDIHINAIAIGRWK